MFFDNCFKIAMSRKVIANSSNVIINSNQAVS